jgi:hypothetical protein
MRAPRTIADLVTPVRDRVRTGDGRGRFIGLEHAPTGRLRLRGHGDAADLRTYATRFQAGDLLFAALRPELRKVVRAPWAGVGSAEWLVLRPKPGALAGVALALLSDPGTLDRVARRATGTRMPRIRWSALADLPVPDVGPDALAAIDRLARTIDERLTLSDRLQRERARLLEALVDAGAAPGGPTVGEVARLAHQGMTPPEQVDPAAPCWGVADLPTSGFDVLPRRGEPPTSRKRRTFAGDVLVSTLRPELRKIGVCPEDGFVSTEVAVLRPAPGWRGALLATLRQPGTTARLVAAATGTRMPRVPSATLLETVVAVPPSVVATHGETLDRLADGIAAEAAFADALARTRDATLRALCSGAAVPRQSDARRAPPRA